MLIMAFSLIKDLSTCIILNKGINSLTSSSAADIHDDEGQYQPYTDNYS